MHYLIDGHNLIARLPDISLSDPDDEARLVGRLKQWAAADRRRKATVVFDAGLPGGEDKRLSGGGVRVVFAPNNSTADAVIIGRLSQIKNPDEYRVVSSDRAVLAAAQQRRVAVVRAEAFAAELAPRTGASQQPAADRSEAPTLSPAELDEWLALFGPEPERPPSAGRAARRPAGRNSPD